MKKITKLETLPDIRSITAYTGIKRVAGYARVSTMKEEQQSSLNSQEEYYSQLIKDKADWNFVGMYVDSGISGLKVKERYGFNNLIQDALDVKIDLIITKSISRFARNTLDTLNTIRKLKENNVFVYFEKED